MKHMKPLLLVCSLFALAGCTTNQGAALTVDNASTYIEPLKEDVLNASYDTTKVSFSLAPNATAGKLFSPDIQGKCSVTVKYVVGEQHCFLRKHPLLFSHLH